jgi:hypothetical protein
MASSIKAGLDIDWREPEAKSDALDRLMTWVSKHTARALTRP